MNLQESAIDIGAIIPRKSRIVKGSIHGPSKTGSVSVECVHMYRYVTHFCTGGHIYRLQGQSCRSGQHKNVIDILVFKAHNILPWHLATASQSVLSSKDQKLFGWYSVNRHNRGTHYNLVSLEPRHLCEFCAQFNKKW